MTKNSAPYLGLLLLACMAFPEGKGMTNHGATAVHGHRGTRGTRPENTMPAFQEAARLGVDFLELDVHLTKDDIPLISHDPHILQKALPQ